MAFKNILVQLGEDRRNVARLDVALDLAKRHEAKLTGLCPPGIVTVDDGPLAAPATAAPSRSEDETQHGRLVRDQFMERAANESVKGDWRVATHEMSRELELRARHADLVVVGQQDPRGSSASDGALVSHLIMGSGTPVIAVPYVGSFKRVGARVLVAWDGSREASRAVHDALPILAGAQNVRLCEINRPNDQSLTDLQEYLLCHGVEAQAAPTVSRLPPDETAIIGHRSVGVGDLLLSAASDFSADLLVMGAYGHSRLRELILGGATRYVLQHMTLPVLMSH